MSRLGFAIAIALGAALPLGVAAQDVTARLEGRISADVARAVRDIARDAAGRGVPVEPLIQKAIEGGAKGVPPERVIAALHALAARLDQARSALHDAGIAAPSPEVVEGGADALNAGLGTNELRELVRVSRPPYDLTLTLRVAATLAALGVPAHQTLELVEDVIKAGRPPTDLMELPSEVQGSMSHGATPSHGGRAAHGPPPVRPPKPPPGRPDPHKP